VTQCKHYNHQLCTCCSRSR